MIRINFIANELAQEKYQRIRKYSLVAYSGLWALSLLILLIEFQHQRSLVADRREQIDRLKVKIEQISPLFQKAVQLYKARNQHKKKLSNVYAVAVESGFVVESLAMLNRTLPQNFWLQKVHITTSSAKAADNKQKGQGSKKMVVSGNVFLNTADENQDHIQRFQKSLADTQPFSFAESRLDLNKMSVSKLKDRYYYNFEMEFLWPQLIL